MEKRRIASTGTISHLLPPEVTPRSGEQGGEKQMSFCMCAQLWRRVGVKEYRSLGLSRDIVAFSSCRVAAGRLHIHNLR
jgi:hypothetical protein